MTGDKHEIAIEHKEQDSRGGAFFIEREGTILAEMVYTRSAPDHVTIVHTEVDEALRGMGVARKLLDTAVAWARATHTRVSATCPYAKAQFEKDASIRDVLAP
jgi:predicted GNAT family acetyltransferase